MTTQPADIPSKTNTRLTPRFRRFAAVLGLCVIVTPISGFWVEVNDEMRGISAVRMRIDYSVEAGMVEVPVRAPRYFSFSGNDTLPLSLDRGRFRATLRDVAMDASTAAPMPAPVTERNDPATSLISLYNNQVALALADATYLPLRRISMAKPSQTYRLWAEQTSFMPADGRHRNADPTGSRWLTDATWELGGFCKNDAETTLAADMQRLLLRIQVPFSAKPHAKSGQYMEMIFHSARRFGLSPQLIYAIMRTESAFNPFAVSNAGALGLMQVVPESAGNEVRAYLTGVTGKPTTTMLFDPKNNIEYGSAYLHLLATRYFSGITNQTSRELCMIAGYNAGPRAVLRVFNADPELAVAAINAITPEELFQLLSRKMPAEETRQYVGKVLSAISSYPG